MATTDPSDYTLDLSPYPAKSLTATALIADVPAVCMRMSFADRILLTISQEGRLAYWLQTPLLPSLQSTLTAHSSQPNAESETTPLPPTHLTPSPLLGTPPPLLAIFAQTIATKTGGLILKRSKEENRPLVVGVGFSSATVKSVEKGGEEQKEIFGQIVGLVGQVL